MHKHVPRDHQWGLEAEQSDHKPENDAGLDAVLLGLLRLVTLGHDSEAKVRCSTVKVLGFNPVVS
jgi:hypothetical protein